MPDSSANFGYPESGLGTVFDKWEAGCRPLDMCLKAAEVSQAKRKELEEVRDGREAVDREGESKLLAAGVPPDLARRETPPDLFRSEKLTLAQQLGLQQFANTVYIAKMCGMTEDQIAIQLAYVGELDLTAARQAVANVGLHVRPKFHGLPVSGVTRGKRKGMMSVALTAPFVVALILKSLMNVDSIFAVLAGVSFLVFPFARSLLSKRTIQLRRENADDGLILLANDARKPVLYLRSHLLDGSEQESDAIHRHFFQSTEMRTLEERLSNVLAVVGPVIALEGPDEGLPNIGASRIRIHDVRNGDWQRFVQGLMVRASLVVVRYRKTEGTRWEVRELLRICPPHQIVFILTTPGDDLSQRDLAWVSLREHLAGWVQGDLLAQLGKYDYCLAFDTQRNPKIFGERSLLFGAQAGFFHALIAAASHGNPFFEAEAARKQAILNSA